ATEAQDQSHVAQDPTVDVATDGVGEGAKAVVVEDVQVATATTAADETSEAVDEVVEIGLLSECHLLVLFLSPYQTLAPNGPNGLSGSNGSVVRVEKPVVSVQTVMIELVRTLPHPELQISRDNYVGCGLVDHTESK
ncbi:hypothetical protein Dimus_029518, partial [Dionaea muscipula]